MAGLQELIAKTHAEDKWKKVIDDLKHGRKTYPNFTYDHGVLLFKGRVVISRRSVWIPKLLKEFHETPIGGHSGFYRTYRRMATNLYWQGMKEDICKFVQGCDMCQRQKYLTTTPGGLLQPLPMPNHMWEDVTLDFNTGLPRSKGYEVILVVVDRLSKYSYFIPLKHPYIARTIVEVFVKEVVRLHRIPNLVVSDRDPLFMSLFWKEFFRMQGTTLRMSMAYHPQSDGQTEVVSRCLEIYLRCYITDHPKGWSQWLPWAEYWCNTTFHVTTRTTLFEAVYGRPPPMIIKSVQREVRVEAVLRELQDRD